MDAVPGVDRCVAEVVLAEVGADMKPFLTHQNLASWAGMCPGNEDSAGKRRRRGITPGKSLAETDLGAGRLGGEPYQEYLPGMPIPALGSAPRQEARPGCDRSS